MILFLFIYGIHSRNILLKNELPPRDSEIFPTNILFNYTDVWSSSISNRFHQAFVYARNTDFNNLYESYYGGALLAVSCHVIFRIVTIRNCYSNVGGAIFLINGDLFLYLTNIEICTGLSIAGGICALGSPNFKFLPSPIPGSQFSSGHSSVYISRCSFYSLVSYIAFGGALFDHINSIVIENCNFAHCKTMLSAGAIGIVGPGSSEDESIYDEEYSAPTIFATDFRLCGVLRQRNIVRISESHGQLWTKLTKTYHSSKWIKENVQSQIKKGGGAIAVHNYSYLYTENCNFYRNFIKYDEKTPEYPGIDIFFHNVDQYLSFNDTITKNYSNLIGYSFDDNLIRSSSRELEIIRRSPQYQTETTEPQPEYLKTETFTPQDIKANNRQFPTINNNDFNYVDQTPYPTNPKRTPDERFKFTYSTPPPFRTEVLKTIHSRFNILATPTATESPIATESIPVPTESPYQVSVTKSCSLTISWTYCKSVTLSAVDEVSYTVFYTYNDGTFYETLSAVISQSYLPYIIQVLTPYYVPTVQVFEMNVGKKKISSEQLIGVVCGSVAAVFLIIAIVIFAIRRKNEYYQFSDISNVTDSSASENNSGGKTDEKAFNMHAMSVEPDHDNWL